MKALSLILFSGLFLFIISCKKEPDAPKGNNKIIFGTMRIDSTSYYNITVSAQLISVEGNQIQQHGFCWGTSPNPDVKGNHSSLGKLNDNTFSQQINNLNSGTKYFIRPYVTYSYGNRYGEQVDTVSKQLSSPNVITGFATKIGYDSATLTGSVSSDGGSNIIRRGVCWDTASKPTLLNCIGSTDCGSGIGTFSVIIKSLSDNTLYFFSAYATNSSGTQYGEVKQFTTLQLFVPQITTSNVTNINPTYITTGGQINSDGGSPVMERGVCYSTSQYPTILDPHTSNGSGSGSFLSNVEGLVNNTQYHVRAYAINKKGVGYGNDIVFSTSNNVYSDDFNRTSLGIHWTVRFGTWSIENNTLKHVGDGSSNSNFILFDAPIDWDQYTIECKIMWSTLGWGFFEDGIAAGYKVISTPTNNGLYIDEYILGTLSSYTPERASLIKTYRNGNTNSDTILNNTNLGFTIARGTWYNFKIRFLRISGAQYQISFYIDGVRYFINPFILNGNIIALGGWKGQYEQIIYFDDFVVTKIN